MSASAFAFYFFAAALFVPLFVELELLDFFFGAAFLDFFGAEALGIAFFEPAFFAAFFIAACGEAAICEYGGMGIVGGWKGYRKSEEEECSR